MSKQKTVKLILVVGAFLVLSTMIGSGIYFSIHHGVNEMGFIGNVIGFILGLCISVIVLGVLTLIIVCMCQLFIAIYEVYQDSRNRQG